MAILIRKRWEPVLASGLPRRDRAGCDYDCYVPDQLRDRLISLDGDVAADVADAENALARFNAEASALADSEALARLLLRAEAVASSRIEGLEVGGRRLLRAQAALALGENPSDVTAEEVLDNISAMAWAVDVPANAPRLVVDHLLEANRLLLASTRLADRGGVLREGQNWIGGSSYNPCGAAFVPPPPEQVKPLLQDLCDFCNQDSLPAVVQAALAHAQFETIHPFADGNGRTGRALIHVVLRRRGLAPRLLPPISLVLATSPADYIAGLTASRYLGDPAGEVARHGVNRWVSLFATAARRSVEDSVSFELRVRKLTDAWRARAGRVRKDSATDRLLEALPGAPIVTVESAGTLIQRSFQATNDAVTRLVEAGVLRPVTVGRRNRAFEAVGLIDEFTAFERQLASPASDTRASPPARAVPRRT